MDRHRWSRSVRVDGRWGGLDVKRAVSAVTETMERDCTREKSKSKYRKFDDPSR
jgi:hypothetical protein